MVARKTLDPWIGRLLAKRYKLLALVGHGSMGKVYRAADTLLGGVPVAVKFLSQTLLDDRGKERFGSEARACALLSNRSINIVRVMDFGVDESELPFYVMEYLTGESLREMIDIQPLPLEQFFPLAQQVCRGLLVAHQGIQVDGQVWTVVHRDIKPSNIFVVRDPGLGLLAKILDFGIAKLVSDLPESRQTSHFTGTLAYCSPEQLEGRSLDHRSDIYSMGILFFEMLTGQVPIQAHTESIGAWYRAHHLQAPPKLTDINPKLQAPEALETLIHGLLAKGPEDRPQTVAQILGTLEQIDRQISQAVANTPAGQGVTLQPQPPKSPAAQSPPPPNLPPAAAPPSDTAPAPNPWSVVTWPQDKPVSKIVFPKLLRSNDSRIPSLWVMLSQSEIDERSLSRCYNQFLFTASPHPMVLWLTALYQPEREPRWLPCYLDLRTQAGQLICRALADIGHYYVVFFSLENPRYYAHRIEVALSNQQRPLLQEWADTGQNSTLPIAPELSKEALKREFERIKPQILVKLSSQLQAGRFS
ncbi:MAG: serine/threonine protein kinase [Gloeomargaritaceae cyanobacterium C42_A2020_066]|nr:serine/threonine protein kinase [Gloeomargaritaceae cyanobacterium C42_A2020_066]